MNNHRAEEFPTPSSIAGYVKKNAAKVKMRSMMHHGSVESVRQDDYQGHHIVIRTSYDIQVDGTPVTGHLLVTNAGEVQYHGLPNMSFDSAVDLVRTLIDNFPDDFPVGKKTPNSHMPGMAGSMPGRKKAPARNAAKAKSSRPSKAK